MPTQEQHRRALRHVLAIAQPQVEPCTDQYDCDCSACRKLVADRVRMIRPGHGLKTHGLPIKHAA